MDLSRFVEAQHRDFDRALTEIGEGRKRSHWMWYVFPQLAGLGRSAVAQHYAIGSLDEARAFLHHPMLGANYRQLVDAVWEQVVQRGRSIHAIFGSPDDVKLVSSLTLFAGAARQLDAAASATEWSQFVSRADEVLAAADREGLPRCATTEQLLDAAG